MTEARHPVVAEAGPVHDQREIDAVVRVLESPGRLAIGAEVAEFERRGAELLAKRHAVMVNSGTSALWLAVDLLGCEPGDEVITSPLTFSSDIAPLVRNGIVPAFVDVEPDTFQIDVGQIEGMVGPRTKAILTPNLVGNCPDWDAIRAVADRHGLIVVEDSCDVLDAHLRGTRTGTRSHVSVTSFARGHSITAGGNGGMIAVDDPEWFDQTLVRRRWGRRSERYLFGSLRGSPERFGELADGTPYDLVFVFDDTGYNFEPSEISAAYGNVQLDRLGEFNQRRRDNFARFDAVLVDHEDKVVRPRTTPELDTTWMRFPFLLAKGVDRNGMQEFLAARGIPTRMVWTGNVLRQPGFVAIPHRAPPGGLPNADLVMDRGLSLPSHNGLSSDAVGHIAASLAEYLRTLG
jgi:CDP-4-dehydro-6-deoxyglucose reductase, E1